MLYVFVCFTFAFFTLGAQAAESPAAAAKQLVIVGDSLTEGYGVSRELAFPALVQKKIDKLGKKWRVVNAGISGATSASAVSRVEWHLKQKPALILIALGANDGLRGQPVKTIGENLTRAIGAAKKANVPVILAGMKMPPNYGNAYAQQFEKIFESVATKEGVQLLPFLLVGVAGNQSLNLADGIHPNEKGHAVVAETVFNFIQKSL